MQRQMHHVFRQMRIGRHRNGKLCAPLSGLCHIAIEQTQSGQGVRVYACSGHGGMAGGLQRCRAAGNRIAVINTHAAYAHKPGAV